MDNKAIIRIDLKNGEMVGNILELNGFTKAQIKKQVSETIKDLHKSGLPFFIKNDFANGKIEEITKNQILKIQVL